MTQSDSELYTIHYADGRVDGPVGAQVIRDLILARIVTSRDKLSLSGGDPKPYGEFPEFASSGSSKAGAAVSGARLSRARRSGSMPTVRRKEGDSGGSRTLRRRSPKVVPPPEGGFLRTGSMPAVPKPKSQPLVPPPTSPGPPSVPEAVASGVKVERFSEEMIKLGALSLRDKLLMSPLTDILGIGENAQKIAYKQACMDRTKQVFKSFRFVTDSEEKLAVLDIVNILLETCDVMVDSSKASSYFESRTPSGKMLSFQNAVPFLFVVPEDKEQARRLMDARIAALGVTESSEQPEAAPVSEPEVMVSKPPVVPAPPSIPTPPAVPPIPSAAGEDEGGIAARLAKQRKTSELPQIDGGIAARLAQQRKTSEIPIPDLSSMGGEAAGWLSTDDLPSLDDILPSNISMDGDDGTPTPKYPFPEGWLEKGAESLRDRLLISSLPDILGVTIEQVDEMEAAQTERLILLQEHFNPTQRPKEEQLILTDIVEIITRSAQALIDDESRANYIENSSRRPPSFQNFVRFAFATESMFTKDHGIRKARSIGSTTTIRSKRAVSGRAVRLTGENRSVGATAENPVVPPVETPEPPIGSPEAVSVVSLDSGSRRRMPREHGSTKEQRPLPPEERVSLEMPILGGSDAPPNMDEITSLSGGSISDYEEPRKIVTGMQAAVGNIAAMNRQPEPPQRTTGSQRAMGSPRTTGSQKTVSKDKGKGKGKSKKDERLKKFKGAAFKEEGDPFTGELVFGVGRADRGLIQVLGIYALVFGVSFALVTVGGFGKRELNLDPNEEMIYIRNVFLIIMAVVGVLVVRRENVLRFGFFPNIIPTLIAVPVTIGMGFLAQVVARFDIEAGVTLSEITSVIVLRSIAEALFFHGFVTRTLLVEFKNPAGALLLSSFLYGLYAITYTALFGENPFDSMYAVFIYAFGAGFPFSIIYYRTKSIFVTGFCFFILLMFCAAGGVKFAENFL